MYLKFPYTSYNTTCFTSIFTDSGLISVQVHELSTVA